MSANALGTIGSGKLPSRFAAREARMLQPSCCSLWCAGCASIAATTSWSPSAAITASPCSLPAVTACTSGEQPFRVIQNQTCCGVLGTKGTGGKVDRTGAVAAGFARSSPARHPCRSRSGCSCPCRSPSQKHLHQPHPSHLYHHLIGMGPHRSRCCFHPC
jgi:hypothetical protein